MSGTTVFYNCHAPLSFDFLRGGWWYIYGNEGWFDERPGLWYQDNRGGTILKLHDEPPFPSAKHPWFFFNNSWYTRTFLLKKSRTQHFTHVNNAYLFCNPADHPPCDCRADRELLSGFPAGGAGWDPTVRFDHDLSSKPFGLLRDRHGQEQQGVVASDPGFIAPRKGDFRLTAGQRGARQGHAACPPCLLSTGPATSTGRCSSLTEASRTSGAWQGDRLVRAIGFAGRARTALLA